MERTARIKKICMKAAKKRLEMLWAAQATQCEQGLPESNESKESNEEPSSSHAHQQWNSFQHAAKDILDRLISDLSEHGLQWGDLVNYISDPHSKRGTLRYYGFFAKEGTVQSVLDNWLPWENCAGCKIVHE
ncbi:hypothetical protein PHLCEN_2v3921 [Hermanssonia centrifuga]|uniref:Uncharacterized protein n=1 Tax=Hermanssonia centrifuga TaxID=98765 RepID=A0A2R6QB69_9APHY|nr:hypothetical protein PHLCEN_2v3921 [Hermanssonia centrifuga]